MRIRAIAQIVACAGVLLLAGGCLTDQQQAGGPSRAASCDECHSYPGSALCKATEITVEGAPRTGCVMCHRGSIVADSARTGSGEWVYFDSMVLSADSVVRPHTTGKHANGAVETEFGRCDQCHSFPPSNAGHRVHVTDNGKSCLECHDRTVRYDIVYDSSESPPAPVFLPRKFPGFGGSLLPEPSDTGHLNRAIDVSMRKHDEAAGSAGGDTVYLWNGANRSCSAVECHSSDSTRHISYW